MTMLDHRGDAISRAAKHIPVDRQANQWYPFGDQYFLQADPSIGDHPLSYHAGTNARAA